MEGFDYRLDDGSLVDGANVVLSSTATRRCITIDIFSDETPEPTESFTIVLRNTDMVPSNVTLSFNQTEVVILDVNSIGRCYLQASLG